MIFPMSSSSETVSAMKLLWDAARLDGLLLDAMVWKLRCMIPGAGKMKSSVFILSSFVCFGERDLFTFAL